MSLSGALEGIVLKFLGPYVEGIDARKLQYGILRGHIDLESIKVKPDVLSMFGVEGFRIDNGLIGAIRVRVPWHSLYSGRLSVEVENVQVHVQHTGDSRSDKEFIKESREAKTKAIEARVEQLRDWMRQSSLAAATSEVGASLGMNMALKFINNLVVRVADVNMSLKSESLGVDAGVGLPELAVASANEGEAAEKTTAITAPISKTLRVQGFFVRLKAGEGVACRKEAGGAEADSQYVVAPTCTTMQLGVEPLKQIIQLRIRLGAEVVNQVSLSKLQLRQLVYAGAALEEQQLQLRARLVPQRVEKAILETADARSSEYCGLWCKQIVKQRRRESPATLESQRLQLLEDVLPTYALAMQRCIAEDAADKIIPAPNMNPVVVQWLQSAFAKVRFGCAAQVETNDALRHLKSEAQNDAAVDPPQNFDIQLDIGALTFSLIDDERDSYLDRQLLQVKIRQTVVAVDAAMATDCYGNVSATFKVAGKLGAVTAHHAGMRVLGICNGGANYQSQDVADAEGEDTDFGAHLLIENKLEETGNILVLEFDLAPHDIRIYPSMVQQMLKFVEPLTSPPARNMAEVMLLNTPSSRSAAEPPDVFSPMSVSSEVATAVELVAIADTAQEAQGDGQGQGGLDVEEVSKRLPDRISFNVTIASPTIYVPAPGSGTVVLKLGRLLARSPSHCELSKMCITLDLTETSLRVETDAGETFSVIQPLPVSVELNQCVTDAEVRMSVSVAVGELRVSMAPHSVQVAAAVAAALMPPPSPDSGVAPAPPPPPEPQPLVDQATDGPQTAMLKEHARMKVEEFVKQRFVLHVGAHLDGVVLVVSDAVAPILRVSLRLPAPGVEMHSEGLLSGAGLRSTVTLREIGVKANALNPRSGVWEPVLEDFRIGAGIVMEPAQAATEGAPPDSATSTKVAIAGQRQLLLNVSPSMIRHILSMTPLFVDSLAPLSQGPATGEDVEPSIGCLEGRYRVLNLSDAAVEVRASSLQTSSEPLRVQPTGSRYASMDDLVLSCEAETLQVSIPGGEMSEFLHLAQPGAVKVPGSGAVAELLITADGRRALVVAAPLRLHNQADVAVQLRFHDESGAVLPGAVPASMACDAALLGRKPPTCAVQSKYAGAAAEVAGDNVLVVPPNGFCGVPPSALLGKAGKQQHLKRHALVSLRLCGADVAFSEPTWLGPADDHAGGSGCITCTDAAAVAAAEAEQDALGERPADRRGKRVSCLGCNVAAPVRQPHALGGNGKARQVHLRHEAEVQAVASPGESSAMTVATVVLKPALVLVNAFPFGNVSLRCAAHSHDDWREVALPPCAAYNLYDIAAPDVDISARLEESAPWSPSKHFSRSELMKAGGQHRLELRSNADSAAGCAVVDAVDTYRLRLSCPFWLADRSGITGGVRVQVGGKPLPTFGSVTMLQKDCFEKACEFEARTSSGEHASHSLRLPPDFCQFPWKMPSGVRTYCLQSEAIAPSGALGAQSTVLTLRPHLVVTNDSQQPVALRLPSAEDAAAQASPHRASGVHLPTGGLAPLRKLRDGVQHGFSGAVAGSPTGGDDAGSTLLAAGVVLRLEPGESRELHIDLGHKEGKDESEKASLCFRPDDGLEGAWSAPVICSEASAGSHAFLLLRGGAPEAWTADVAPQRGSMAITLRPGSIFVARNRVKTSPEVRMAIRSRYPGAADTAAASSDADVGVTLPVPPGGREVPFGWLRPLGKKSNCHIEVLLDDKVVPIPDVRRSTRRVVQVGDRALAIHIARVRERTVLSVVETTAEASGGSTLQVELKLSRLGISIMQEHPHPSELLFVALDVIRLDYKQSSEVDAEEIRLLVSDIQVMCQTPERNESGSGKKELLGPDRRAVLVAEASKKEDAHFLDVLIQREATSSQDLILGKVDVVINKLDIEVDEGWLDPLLQGVTTMVPSELADGIGLPFSKVIATAGKSVIDGYTAPPTPPVVQIESLSISAVELVIWCSVPIRSLDALPVYLKGALMMVCLGDRFSLNGASLNLAGKQLPAVRGSAPDVAAGLVSEYTLGLVGNVMTLLGKSSLVALPAVPFKLAGAVVTGVGDGLGAATGEAAARLTHLVFDEKYVKQQQEKRDNKQIRHAGDGVIEAGKSLAQGVGGVLDIVRKPVEGARNGGLQGFAVGIGQGVAGAVVKPVIGVGGAVSDLGSGVAAAFAGHRGLDENLLRWRQPRLLFAALGEVRPFSDVEAEFQKRLGVEAVKGVLEVVVLSRQPGRIVALLVFRSKLILAEITYDLPQGQKPIAAAESFFGKRCSKLFKPIHGSQARELALADCSAAQWDEAAKALVLQERAGATRHAVPLESAAIAEESRGLLVEALQAAVGDAQRKGGASADWRALRAARIREQAAGLSSDPPITDECGKLEVQVVEVQRRKPGNVWVAPYLPTDRHIGWRWVDLRGSKHPSLERGLQQEQCAARETPPCEMDSRFKPVCDWKVQVGDQTDQDGWAYSLAWSSSNWQAVPGCSDQLRRRVWVRQFE